MLHIPYAHRRSTTLTRVFESNNSLAVRISEELANALAELRHSVECDPNTKREAEHALDAPQTCLPVLPVDGMVAVHYGVFATAVGVRRRDALDRLNAAHVASLGLMLITSNEADSRDYPGLVVENWG